MNVIRVSIKRLVLLLLPALWLGSAQANNSPEFKGKDDQAIVTFSQHHGMVRGSDVHAQVEVYANGKVRVFLPDYMKGAGTYEYLLSMKSLRAIVSRLEYLGLMDFDAEQVRASQQEINRLSDVQFALLDETTTRIALYFSSYAKKGQQAKALSKRIEWRDIAVDAKRFPQLTSLRGLADVEQLLYSLTDHQRRGGVRVDGGQ